MQKIVKSPALIILMLIVGLRSLAQTIEFNDGRELTDISSYVQHYEDKTGKLTFGEAIKMPFDSSKHDVLNFGITGSSFWIKIIIHNNSKDERLMLDLQLPTLDDVEFYAPAYDGKYSITVEGEKFPFNVRKYVDPDYLFDVYVPLNSTRVFYMKVASKEGIQLPVKLGTKESVYNYIKTRDILSGIYFGIMMAMVLYNLFVYFSVRDKNYIYYVCYIVLILFTQTSLQGYPFQYLWPGYPKMAQMGLFIFPSLVSMAGLIFIRNFLIVKSYSKVLYILSYVLYLPYLISIALAFAGYFNASFHFMESGSMTVSVYMLFTSIYILRKGFNPAKYFLAAWVTFLIGVFIYILKDFEVLPFNSFTRYTMHIGSGIETVLLSFALANRINVYKKEKEESQAQSLELARENERIIKEQNIYLEEKITERTAELEASNKSLKEAEAHLVNAEKMASLGQLTAGISHEINNPINFVVSNVKPLKRDVDDILTVLSFYGQIKNAEEFEQRIKDIDALKKKIDLDYVTKEIAQLLKGIDEGANRTAEIVKGLKNFSRANEDTLKFVNLHEGIDATLTILNSNIQSSHINIIKNYGNLPPVECSPGKINQVFMNIITNAIHAVLEKNGTDGKGLITISTSLAGQFAEVRIKDNGTGIPETNLQKIYEPFFTTKAVGMGTGLGLSIVYGIIQSHMGEIKVNSVMGEGTEFIIRLPFKQR